MNLISNSLKNEYQTLTFNTAVYTYWHNTVLMGLSLNIIDLKIILINDGCLCSLTQQYAPV